MQGKRMTPEQENMIIELMDILNVSLNLGSEPTRFFFACWEDDASEPIFAGTNDDNEAQVSTMLEIIRAHGRVPMGVAAGHA
jgi:hypothetical protein